MRKSINIYFCFISLVISASIFGQNYSLSFDGESGAYVYVSDSQSLNFGSSSITYSVWFKKPESSHYLQTNLITDYINPTNPTFGLFIQGEYGAEDVGKVRVFYRTNADDSETKIISSQRYDDNEWHHAVAIKDYGASKILLYIDGNLEDEQNVNMGDTYTGQGLIFAGAHSNRYMDVTLDEVSVLDKALSQEEIEEIYSLSSSADLTQLNSTTENLRGYWRMNEGSGTEISDASGQGNMGIINGGTAWSTDVPPILPTPGGNNSLSFDGLDDYVDLGNNELVGPTQSNPLTMSLWIKLNSLDNIIASKYENSNSNNSNFYLGTTNDGHFSVGGNGTNAFHFGTVELNQWQHVTVVFDNSTITSAYVNGVLANSGQINLSSNISSEPLLIGAMSGNSDKLNGLVDEVKIWSIALNQEQIQSNMYSNLNGDEEGLVGYWDFNEGEEINLADLSGNGNDGTIYGATWSGDVPTPPVFGCTDTYADNYNSEATSDDGSCFYPDNGNYSLSFDEQDDHVVFSENGLGSGNGNFTILFKMKTEDLNNTGAVMGKGHQNGDISNSDFHIYYYQNNLHVGTYNSFANQTAIPFESYMNNEWINLAITWDGSAMETFIDGETAGVIYPPYSATDGTMSIGRDITAGVGSGNFDIDELQIWNQVLDVEEIQSFPNNILNDYGLVGYWKMDSGEDEILYDHSGGQNHGDINGATWYLPATPGENNSLSFDGDDDRVELPNQMTEGLTSVTFMAWFNTTDHSGYSDIVQQDATSGALFIRYDPDGSFKYVFKADQGWRSISISPPSYGVWHHVAMSWDGNNINAYLDGEEVGSSNGSGLISGGGPIYIGNWQQSEGFSGKIDDVQYWDIALSESEIQIHMNTELSGNEEGLIGYWNFNEGEGSELTDLSGNGYNGTIYGASWSGDSAPVQEPLTPGSVVINEIFYNPSFSLGSDYDYEFLELYNPGGEDVDMSGYYFTQGINHTFEYGTVLPAESFLILTHPKDEGDLFENPYDIDGDGYNDNGIQVIEWMSGVLSNSGEDIEIVDSIGNVIDYVDYEDGANDYGDWGTSHDGGGPSLELFDYNSDNSLAENWQSSWVPNGTPGDEVSSEPEAIVLTIQDIQYVDGDNTESIFRGEYVETTGVITGIDSIGTGPFIIQDGSGAWNGIYCWWPAPNDVSMGDNVTVRGFVEENVGYGDYGDPNRGLTVLNTGRVVSINSSDNELPVPVQLSISEAKSEQYEGVRVSVIGFVTMEASSETNNEWQISDGSDSIFVNDRFVYTNPSPGMEMLVTGPLNEWGGSSNSSPSWRIEPATEEDVVEYVEPSFSLSFDGIDDYVMGNSTDLDNLFSGYNPFSISFWVKQSSESSASDFQNIFGKGYTQNNVGENPTSVMIQTHLNGFCQIMLYSGQTTFIGVYGSNVIDQDEWTLLTFTYDGGNDPSSLKIYKNGSFFENYQYTSNGGYSGMITSAGEPFFLGSKVMENGTPHLPYIGEIDDGRVWDYVISEEEIQFNWNSALSGDETGLVSYWDFNEGDGNILTDITDNGNNGTINGATWSDDIYIPPISGCTDQYAQNFNNEATVDDGSCYGYPQDGNASLSFSGDADYIEILSSDNFDLSDEQRLTISAYIKTTGNNEVIFQAEESYGYFISTHNDGEFSLTMYFDGYEDLCTSNTQVTDGNWHHVAGVYDGSEIKIYVDGVLENSCAAGVLVSQDQSSPITIGSYRPGESNYQFNGHIDELSIWSEDLGPDQISEMVLQDSVWQYNNLIAHYKFNENGGDILFDHSGKANHGAINGASWDQGFEAPPIEVTLLVNMQEYVQTSGDSLYEGVYVAGGNIGADNPEDSLFMGHAMSDENGDFIYEVTLDLERNTHYNYKYRIGPAAVDWNGYWEVGLEECGEGQWSDRYFDTDFSSSMVVGPYCFSSCDNCEIPNHSLSFDGNDDYADINSSEIDGNSSLSISFWVKLNDLNQNNTVISRTSNSSNIFSLSYEAGTSSFHFMTRDDNGSNYHNYIEFAPNESEWYHIVMQREAGIAKRLFVNGELEFEIGDPNSNLTLPSLRIGANEQGGSNANMQFDNLQIWNTAISHSFIQENMYNDLSGYEDGLVGYWNMNEGEGNILTDLSGNGNNGTIYGATWSDDFPLPPYNGPEWYVYEDGSDDNNGSIDHPFATIQHAINSANDGDFIIVNHGTYYENINFYGKQVKVYSAHGPEQTIIDGQGLNTAVVAFRDIDYYDAGIYGFTIQNAEYGVMVLNGGSPEIRGCIVRDITIGGDGGFYIAGDGIGSSPTVIECLVYGNESNSGEGGGIRVASNNGSTSAMIINCTIVGNSPEGIRVHGSETSVEVINTIIYDNPISITNLGNIGVSFSNVEGGYDGESNFDEDPQFCNPGIGNYHLAENSSSFFMGSDSSYVGCYADPDCESSYSNYSLSFDGNDDQVELFPELFDGLEAFTFQAMFYTDVDQNGVSNIIQHDGPNDDFYIRYENGNTFRSVLKVDDDGYPIDITHPVKNTWHHIAYTYDGSICYFYLNGETMGSVNIAGGSYTANETIYLGNWNQNEGFNGKIDEVSLYDYALSQDEIQNNSNQALTGLENGLVAYYNFDQASGDSLIDITGNGYDGLIVGASWSEGAPLEAPVFPSPEITSVNVEVNGDDVSFSVEADMLGEESVNFQWRLDGFGPVMSFESTDAQDLRPGLHYVRVALVDQNNEVVSDEVLQSFYILNGLTQHLYTDFEDIDESGLPPGWASFSNGQGWYVSDNPYFEYWTAEPGVGNVIISNDDAANNDGVNDFNDGAYDYLNTLALDFTSFGGPVALEFGSFFTGIWEQTAHVTYSPDGGSNWFYYADISPSEQWERHYYDLGFLEQYDNVIIGFHSSDNGIWGSGCILDDISIIDAYGRKTLSGYVFNSEDNSPIENALVIAVAEDSSFNAQANSDENGFYSMELISDKNYFVNVSMPNYQDYNEYITISDSSFALDVYLDVQEEISDAHVEGTITDWYTNAPLSGASVLFTYSDDEGGMETIESQADQDGYFMVQVPGEVDYDLFLYAEGYWVEHDAFFLSSGEHQVLDIGIAPITSASRLYGMVKDFETGEVIPYAQVQLNCEDASDWDHTGTLGTYRVFSYYPGDCADGVLVVSAEGYQSSVQSVASIDFVAGSSYDLEVELVAGGDPDPGMLSGTIFSNIDGNIILDASVRALNIATEQIFDTQTDSGYFSISLPASEYTLSLNASDHQEKFVSIHIEPGSDIDTVFYLDQSYTNMFTGIVSDPNGNGLGGVTVSANMGGYYDFNDISTFAITSDDGFYELIVPDGNFNLSASLTGYQVSWVYDINIENQVLETDFTLSPVSAFDGGVMGTVYFFGNLSGSTTINFYNDTYSAEVTTSENSSYYLDLVNGTYSVFASSNGYSSIYIPDAITVEDNVINYDMHFTQPGFVEPPVITDLVDVPEDQGRELDMNWSPGDPAGYDSYTQYSIWRKIENLPLGVPDLWHYIETVQFDEGASSYESIVPTLIDANSDTTHFSTFMVTAHTADPFVFFDSPPATGFSLDNVFPAIPADIVISSSVNEESSFVVDLSWSEPVDEDFSYHNVYRVDVSSDESAMIFQVVESSFTDIVSEWGNYDYWVTAVDHNGNESDPSSIAGISLSIVEEVLPTEFTLGQNYPNPFNPSTQIRYALPERSKVTITIYNMLGGKVRTLVNDYQEAGYRSALWNATNDRGTLVSAGMYIYTIQAGSFYQAKKMILLK